MKPLRFFGVMILLALSGLACQALLPSANPPAAVAPQPTAQPEAEISPTQSPVRLSQQNNPYFVSGQTAAELRQQMNRLGPADSHDGKIYDARTDWQINWRFTYQQKINGQCVIQLAEVDVELTYILPQWRDETSAPADLQQNWQTYLQALTLHEQGHGKRALETGEKIYRALLAVPPAADCPSLEESANAAARQVFDAGESLQAQYDRETGHGATQGAVFP